ncbi:MAG: hypothetical protein KGI33_06920, partial [Thaumarchaeota archaeon]|nr:hypothetical protein [Nitrososphaerota archaeon]
TPPATTSTPPATTSTPPATTSTPPATTSTPPATTTPSTISNGPGMTETNNKKSNDYVSPQERSIVLSMIKKWEDYNVIAKH